MRLTLGISQRELGKKLNLSDTTISSYERENSQADFNTILKISDICGFEILFNMPDDRMITVSEMAKEQN